MKSQFIAMLAAPLLLLTPALLPAQAVQPTSQPAAEAMAQKLLPKVRDALWTKLMKCEVSYDGKKDVYSVRVTPEVKALDGQTVTVRGFVLPMDGSDRTKHFLVSRNTPVCMYCPPGQPNEVVEVAVTQGHRMDRQDHDGDRQAQPDQRRREGALLQDRECPGGTIIRAHAASRLTALATVSLPDHLAQTAPFDATLRA